MQTIRIIRYAAVTGALSVALGAFGAHALQSLVEKGSLTENDLRIFETGVRYQFYHTFALLALAALSPYLKEKAQHNAALCFLFGVLIFSGSLYILSMSGYLFGHRLEWLGAITPLGGVALIAGWVIFFTGLKTKEH